MEPHVEQGGQQQAHNPFIASPRQATDPTLQFPKETGEFSIDSVNIPSSDENDISQEIKQTYREAEIIKNIGKERNEHPIFGKEVAYLQEKEQQGWKNLEGSFSVEEVLARTHSVLDSHVIIVTLDRISDHRKDGVIGDKRILYKFVQRNRNGLEIQVLTKKQDELQSQLKEQQDSLALLGEQKGDNHPLYRRQLKSIEETKLEIESTKLRIQLEQGNKDISNARTQLLEKDETHIEALIKANKSDGDPKVIEKARLLRIRFESFLRLLDDQEKRYSLPLSDNISDVMGDIPDTEAFANPNVQVFSVPSDGTPFKELIFDKNEEDWTEKQPDEKEKIAQALSGLDDAIHQSSGEYPAFDIAA